MGIQKFWKNSPEFLSDKSVRQLIGFAGKGKLADGNDTSLEFRALLSEVSSDHLARYADECLTESFTDSGLALQDIINEVGRRLGFEVVNGHYRGRVGAIGNDGLWRLPNDHKIVLEVKTTDAYRFDLKTFAGYRTELIRAGKIAAENSSVLIVVGRSDTGDLEAQVRGSQFAWDMRLISVDALLRLARLNESIDDPDALRRIYEILIPREFTKLDGIVELVFSTAENSQEPLDVAPVEVQIAEGLLVETKKFTPVSFNDKVAGNLSSSLGVPLIKRTRTLFSSPDDAIKAICVVSKEYDPGDHAGYWFAFHPHQKDVLEKTQRGYAAFGCGSPNFIVCVPIKDLSEWTAGMNKTVGENEKFYWHIQISMDAGKPVLVRKKGQPRIDLSRYRIQA